MGNLTQLQKLTKKVRKNILESTTVAGSGHPTSSLSGVELMTALFCGGYLRYNLADVKSLANDRIIFSKGHAAPLLYAMYHAIGHITKEDLLSLRKIDSDFEGHPTPRLPFVDVATGSLGQGLSSGVGMALGIRLAADQQKLNVRRLPHVFVLLGDSEMAEGQVWEAMQIASHYELSNLVGILDVNRLGQRGPTMLEWDIETYEKRIASFGWNTIVVKNGHDLKEVLAAFEKIEKQNGKNGKPTMIIAKTQKGYGVSFLANKDDWHGKPLPKDKMESAIKELGEVDDDIVIKPALPDKDSVFSTIVSSEARIAKLPYKGDEKVATREAYGAFLMEVGKTRTDVVVLDAETSNSTYAEKFKETAADRFFEMYIAEQNMVSTGLGLSKIGYIPFVSSFAAFLTRAFDQIRMGQYSEGNIKIAGSHAGVSIGVDGASQMALEDLSIMRSILDSVVLYPSDALSTFKLGELLLIHKGISYVRLTREKSPIIYSEQEVFSIGGSKVLRQSDKDTAVVVTAGITLHEALKAYDMLKKENITFALIDAYSVKPIDKATILKHAQKTGHVIIVEDHYPYGGLGDAVFEALKGEKCRFTHLAVNKIPRSGQPAELLRMEEIDAEAIVKAVR